MGSRSVGRHLRTAGRGPTGNGSARRPRGCVGTPGSHSRSAHNCTPAPTRRRAPPAGGRTGKRLHAARGTRPEDREALLAERRRVGRLRCRTAELPRGLGRSVGVRAFIAPPLLVVVSAARGDGGISPCTPRTGKRRRRPPQARPTRQTVNFSLQPFQPAPGRRPARPPVTDSLHHPCSKHLTGAPIRAKVERRPFPVGTDPPGPARSLGRRR